MSDLARPCYELAHWFAEHNVPTDSLTVILNFTSGDDAMRFDAAVRHGLQQNLTALGGSIDLRQFEMVGLKIRVESPIHTP